MFCQDATTGDAKTSKPVGPLGNVTLSLGNIPVKVSNNERKLDVGFHGDGGYGVLKMVRQ